MSTAVIILAIMIGLGLVAVISGHRADTKFAEAKKYSSLSKIFMYIFMVFCLLLFATVVFNLDVFNIKLNSDGLTYRVMKGTDYQSSLKKDTKQEQSGTDKIDKGEAEWARHLLEFVEKEFGKSIGPSLKEIVNPDTLKNK